MFQNFKIQPLCIRSPYYLAQFCFPCGPPSRRSGESQEGGSRNEPWDLTGQTPRRGQSRCQTQTFDFGSFWQPRLK